MSQVVTALLQCGSAHLSAGLKDRIAEYVISNRSEDGGFPGRRGRSDPYYTDFALRILSMTHPEKIGNHATPAYARWDEDIADIPECFNRLSIAQLCNVPLPGRAGECLHRHRLASGCYCRSTDLPVPSAYCTFLGTVCEEILGLDSRNWLDSAKEILELQSADGGFADTPSGNDSQTNPTAAALGYLIQASLLGSPLKDMEQSSLDNAINRAGDYLLSMQAEGGGFHAHAEAPYPDLLSTFTALSSLAAMERIKQAQLREHVRFVGLLADANGGFHSCVADTESDIEYTYYGLGCLALIAFITIGA